MSRYRILIFCFYVLVTRHSWATDETSPQAPMTRPIYIEPAPTEDNTIPTFVDHLELLRVEETRYSNSALSANETKNTSLKILVNNRGEVIQSEVTKSSGVEELDNAALKAITKTTFLPYIDKSTGQPTHVYTNFVYTFKQQQVTADTKSDQPKQKHRGAGKKSEENR